MSTLRSSALVLGEPNKRAGPDTVESHMLETKGDAFGPASSSPSALECLECDSAPRVSRPAYWLRLPGPRFGLAGWSVLFRVDPRGLSDAQRRFEPGLVKPFDRHGGGLVADDSHGHCAETTREQIAIRLEIQLDIASEEWDAGL